ncbi:MAG: c-type cytochrome [Pseudomonadota bacterium]
MKIPLFLMLVALIFSASIAVAGDDAAIASPALLAGTCAGCHGTDGASPGPIPPLKGYPASNMKTAMRMFRSGQRPATIMDRLAKGYSDAEIDAIASYFAK